MTSGNLTPPYGTYALDARRERLRAKAFRHPDTWLGRSLISRLRRKVLKGVVQPFDVDIVPGLKARLYPTGNRCEKRAFAGVQTWDSKEREMLERAIKKFDAPRDFVFLDVGANVGLYSLFAWHFGQMAGRGVHVLAVEPSVSTSARLSDNILANQAGIEIVRVAVSDIPGQAQLTSGGDNRGEAMLSQSGLVGTGEAVVVETIYNICHSRGIERIDALKLDVEGHDFKALSGFFDQAPNSLHPGLLILETVHAGGAELIELCEKHGYMLEQTTRQNSILKKR